MLEGRESASGRMAGVILKRVGVGLEEREEFDVPYGFGGWTGA